MPSNKILEQKKGVVSGLAKMMKDAQSGVLVDYRGLTVSEDTQLRNELRAAKVEYKVVKNTLTLFAAREIGLEGLDETLKGPTAMAVSYDDLIAPAKVICEFAKKHQAMEVKAGFFEGRVISGAEVSALADLPPKEVLISQVLAGLNAPISGFVNVLNGNIRGLAVCLNGILEKKQAEA